MIVNLALFDFANHHSEAQKRNITQTNHGHNTKLSSVDNFTINDNNFLKEVDFITQDKNVKTSNSSFATLYMIEVENENIPKPHPKHEFLIDD